MVSIDLGGLVYDEPGARDRLSELSGFFNPESLRPDGLLLEGLLGKTRTPYQITILEFPESGHKLDAETINYVEFGKGYPFEAIPNKYTYHHNAPITVGWLLAGKAPDEEARILSNCSVSYERGRPVRKYPLDAGKMPYPVRGIAHTTLKEPDWRNKRPEEIEELYSKNLERAIIEIMPYVCSILDQIVEDVQKRPAPGHS
jgi:hypothetical protein